MTDHALTSDHIDLLRAIANDHLIQTWKVGREVRGYVGIELERIADFLESLPPTIAVKRQDLHEPDPG